MNYSSRCPSAKMASCVSRLCSIILALTTATLVSSRTCPCPDVSQCNTITTVRDIEVFHWAVRPKMWRKFDWSRITTLALFTPWDNELMCYAHMKGVRVVMATSYPTAKLNDTAMRTEWVLNMTQLAYDNFADGINMDIEGAVDKGSKEVDLLTELVTLTVESFRDTIPGSQITFDAPSTPACYPGGRCYNYSALARVLDFLIIMAYDETGFGRSIAGPNSPYHITARGVEEFKKLGISSDQLAIAYPWYGYDYTCTAYNISNGTCFTNCNISPCGQVSFAVVQDLLACRTDFGREWDPKSLSPFYWYYDEYGGVHQVWYDDVYSLGLKYTYALDDQQMRGIGIWNADLLDYGDILRTNIQTKEMWNKLPEVTSLPGVQEKVLLF